LLAKENKPEMGLRIGVRSGGCSGLSYMLGFDTKQEGDNIQDIFARKKARHLESAVVVQRERVGIIAVHDDPSRNHRPSRHAVHNTSANRCQRDSRIWRAITGGSRRLRLSGNQRRNGRFFEFYIRNIPIADNQRRCKSAVAARVVERDNRVPAGGPGGRDLCHRSPGSR